VPAGPFAAQLSVEPVRLEEHQVRCISTTVELFTSSVIASIVEVLPRRARAWMGEARQ